jgi:hypothetical protein
MTYQVDKKSLATHGRTIQSSDRCRRQPANIVCKLTPRRKRRIADDTSQVGPKHIEQPKANESTVVQLNDMKRWIMTMRTFLCPTRPP